MPLWQTHQSHAQLILFAPNPRPMPTPCQNEAGPSPRADCRTLDLTLGFEYRVLTGFYALTVFLLTCLAARSVLAHRRVTKQMLDPLASLKLGSVAAGVAFAAATCAASRILIFDSRLEEWQIASYALQLAFAVSVALASMTRHSRSVAPSTLLAICLFLSALLGATHLRTLILASAPQPIVVAASLFLAWQVLHLFLELIEKRRWLDPAHIPHAHEPTAGLASRLSFAFLLPLLIRGRKNTLGIDDLKAFGLPPQMATAYAGKTLARELSACNGALLRASRKALLPALIAPVLPKLVQLCATFSQPFVVRWMLEFIADPKQDMARGWALVGAYAAIYLTLAVSMAFYLDKLYAAGMQFRAALVSVIGEKSLRLAASVAESEGASATVYMSLDVDRVVEGTAYVHELWGAIFALVLASIIMWFQASFAVLSTIGIVLLFLVITGWAAAIVQRRQMMWMEATTRRVKFMTSMLTSIIPIKLSAIESRFPGPTSRLREEEVSAMKKLYLRLTSVAVLSSATVNVAGLMALGTYIGLGVNGPLAASDLFTILTVVNLLTLPISTIGHVAPQLLASFASFKRIATFLAAEEKQVQGSGDSEGQSVPPPSLEGGDIVLKGAEFAVEKDGNAILKGLDVVLGKGKITMLVGPVGSGKSVFLRSLLGETYLTGGTISSTSAQFVTAYAAQDAFILPTSIRENIVLCSRYEPGWYGQVISACSLTEDLEAFHAGDATIVGEGGQECSGGQKQRIALARAVYAQADLVLLDDCFSALDSHTARAVFNALLGPAGLLRGKTVILATHSMSHLTLSDDVIVLKGGCVAAQGDLDTLFNSSADLDLGVQKSKTVSAVSSDDGGGPSEAASTFGDDAKDEPDLAIDIDVELIDTAPQIRPEAHASKPNLSSEVDEDSASLQIGGWHAYTFYFASCQRPRLIGTCLLILLFALLEIFLQVFLKEWSESGAGVNGNSHSPWLAGYAAFTIAAACVAGVSFIAYTQWVVPRASRTIHGAMTNAVLNAPLPYFQDVVTPSRLVNRFSSDVNVVDFAFPVSLLDFAFSATFVTGSLILVCISVPWIAIAMPVLLLVYYYIQAFYLATSRQFQRLEMSSKTPLFRSFNTGISGLVTIRAFGAQDMISVQTTAHLDTSQLPMYYRFAGIRFLRTTLCFCTLIVAVLVATLAVSLRKTTNAGFLGVTLSQLVSLSQAVQNVILSWTRVENGAVSVERARAVTFAPVEKQAPPTAAVDLPQGWPTAGKIEFRDVSLRYREDLDPALRDLTLTIEPGKKLGVCGRTGSGKSTITRALLAAVDSSNVTGQILIDGVDISTVPIHVLRSSIGFVAQEPVLFYLTIRENLTIGLERDSLPSDAAILDVLERVGIRECVEKLPDGLDTVLSADGSGFSRGERQLLCVSRVILESRKIVILDEASSSMDVTTDNRLHELLKTALGDCTVIAIAHRISTVSGLDNIAVLSAGRLVEHDTPQALLQNASSHFARLAKNQGISA